MTVFLDFFFEKLSHKVLTGNYGSGGRVTLQEVILLLSCIFV